MSTSNIMLNVMGDITLAPFGATPNSSGASLNNGVLTLQPADGSNPGGVSTAAQTFAGVKTFASLPVFPNQSANTHFAGPSSGAAAAPTFRAMVGADLPLLFTQHIGFNTTLSGWGAAGSNFQVLQCGGASFFLQNSNPRYVGNAYNDGSAWHYYANGTASMLQLQCTAVAGTATGFTLFTAANNVSGNGAACSFNAVFQVDINGNLLIGNPNLPFTTMSTSITVSSNVPYYVSANSLTATLPAAPNAGDLLEFFFATTVTAFTINPNGLKIEATTSNMTHNCYMSNGRLMTLRMKYTDATNGWILQ